MKNIIKILLWIFGSILVSATFIIVFYIAILPALISNKTVINFARKQLKKSNIDLVIDSPKLTTYLKPEINFTVKTLILKNKDKIIVLDLKNIDTHISFPEILSKKIVINKLGADYIFLDINKISELSVKDDKKEDKKSGWYFDLFNTLMYLKNAVVVYEKDDGLMVILKGKDIEITETRNPKFIKFDLTADLLKDGKKLSLKIKDNDSVYTNKRKLYAKNTAFYINSSKVLINYVGAEGGKFDLHVNTNNFSMSDLAELLKTNIIIANGSDILSTFSDIKGSFNFDFNMTNDKKEGQLTLNNLSFSSKFVRNLPMVINKGKIIILTDKIVISGFKGYYGTSTANQLDGGGTIKNYMTDFNINVVGYAVLTKELTNDYISKIIGYPIELVGKSKAKVKFSMDKSKMDLAVIFRLVKHADILVDGSSLTPVNYERAFRADMQIKGDNYELKNLNYYIADSFAPGVVVKPLLKLYGNFDLKTGAMKNLGFQLEKPLPSEFLNVLIGERVFKKGKISGNLEVIANKTKVPYIVGNFMLDDVRIPSQRLSIKKGQIISNNKLINLNFNGRYKRANYEFTSEVLNEIKFPFIVKDCYLKLDNIDVERIMHTVNNQPQTQQTQDASFAQTIADTSESENKADEEVMFNTDLVVIEHALLEIVKGFYKDINFANVKATMTLDKNGILDIHSNKFDIAEGTSGTKIVLDLKNQIYKIKLGIKDVNADIIATTLLNLPKEISGKARGLISIETDKSLKLNGSMKFDIKNGTIAKVGYIEYALNFVTVFRNPLVMISPATLIDLVNVPDGKFDIINGKLELKDNVINRMMIKSKSPELATFIVGRYDLEKSDAILRIYTKFSKKHTGISGILRNFSLNAIANKVSLSNSNDINYYESEIKQIPILDDGEKQSQIFLTKIDGDVQNNNFLSTLKRIK